jgi:hypothetical protein
MNNFECKICCKFYKSSNSLWNHTSKYHNKNMNNLSTKYEQNMNILSTNDQQNENNKKTDRIICNYCNKKYSCYTSVMRHEKKCKEKNLTLASTENNINQITDKIINILKQDNIHIEQKTINKIQKLINNIELNKSNIINSNNNNNNNIVNNINIIGFGKENLREIFTQNEQLEILNRKHSALLTLIEKAHFNPKYPQLHSIILTNHKNDTIYLYDGENNFFKLSDKNESIETIINNKVCDIEDFYNEHKDKLNSSVKKAIETIIEDRYENDDKPLVNKKIRKDINNLLYNNRQKVKHLL